jgi:hypothetical protein
MTPNTSIEKLYKELTIKDAILYTKYAWEDVTTKTINNCWNKIFKSKETIANRCDEEEEENIKNFDDATTLLFPGDVMTQKEFVDLKIDENEIF